jgi:hypothetical protein
MVDTPRCRCVCIASSCQGLLSVGCCCFCCAHFCRRNMSGCLGCFFGDRCVMNRVSCFGGTGSLQHARVSFSGATGGRCQSSRFYRRSSDCRCSIFMGLQQLSVAAACPAPQNEDDIRARDRLIDSGNEGQRCFLTANELDLIQGSGNTREDASNSLVRAQHKAQRDAVCRAGGKVPVDCGHNQRRVPSLQRTTLCRWVFASQESPCENLQPDFTTRGAG